MRGFDYFFLADFLGVLFVVVFFDFLVDIFIAPPLSCLLNKMLGDFSDGVNSNSEPEWWSPLAAMKEPKSSMFLSGLANVPIFPISGRTRSFRAGIQVCAGDEKVAHPFRRAFDRLRSYRSQWLIQ